MGKTSIKCKLCGDIINSAYRWDFKYCSCKNVFIDGGDDYLRYGCEDRSTIEFIENKNEE